MHAYIYPQHLKDEMKETFPDGKPFIAAFKHVQLAEGSQDLELIIPHEDVKKQGYVIINLAHKTTKVSYHNFFTNGNCINEYSTTVYAYNPWCLRTKGYITIL